MSEFTEFLGKGGGRRARDLTGQRFGSIVALSPHSRSRNGHFRWNCVCDCGNEKDILATHLVSGKTLSCGCMRKHGNPPYSGRGSGHAQWTGCGDISGRVWTAIKRGADGSKGRRVIPFEISIEYAWDLFLFQDKMCALSGIDIHFPKHWKDISTASLDRIDSSDGYIEGNVQWLHKDVNRMKNSFDQDYFVEMCKRVSSAVSAGGVCEL